MSLSDLAAQYQPIRTLREMPERAPTEMELQALWFEQWLQEPLRLEDGTEFTVIQPGFWNHAAGPDFLQAAVRRADGTTQVGAVELHLQATDWQNHGHHLDAAYEETILHVVWQRPAKPYFPATAGFRHVPQFFLSDHLLAPWPELAPLLEFPVGQNRPRAQPGLCQKSIAQRSTAEVVELLRTAGAYRLRRKAERLRCMIQARGRPQALWESLAEALGYSQNKLPMRLLAQRLPWALPILSGEVERTALLFGLAGFLPAETLTGLSAAAKTILRPCWDHWWKQRAAYDHALLSRTHWHLANLRPTNRPERRLAALAGIHPLVPDLIKALAAFDSTTFADLLHSIHDPFWSHHTTWRSRRSAQPLALLGAERIADIMLNVYGPLLANQDEAAGLTFFQNLKIGPNHRSRIAHERVLGTRSLGSALREALVQQGLLQIYQDHCLADVSGCAQCPFPSMVQTSGAGL